MTQQRTKSLKSENLTTVPNSAYTHTHTRTHAHNDEIWDLK